MLDTMFVNHFRDSCCFKKSCFSSTSSLMAHLMSGSTLSATRASVDVFDSVAVAAVVVVVVEVVVVVVAAKGAATKLVRNLPPFWISATVQISRISFVIFCLRSDSDLVKRRLFTDVAMALLRTIFSHSLISRFLEDVSSSSS